MQNHSGGSSLVLLYVHRDHKDYWRRGGAQDGHLDFHTAPDLCSTETIRTIRDGEARMATSTFTQLLSCEPGDDRVAIGMDLGPRQYISGDSSALKKPNEQGT